MGWHLKLENKLQMLINQTSAFLYIYKFQKINMQNESYYAIFDKENDNILGIIKKYLKYNHSLIAIR